MIKFGISLAALAMAASVAAAPAATPGTTFSFMQWVEYIVANPDTALTVDEAMGTARAAEVASSAGGLGRDRFVALRRQITGVLQYSPRTWALMRWSRW